MTISTHNNLHSVDVDRIVREVLLQLESHGTSLQSLDVSASPKTLPAQSKAPPKTAGRDLTINDRVITLSHIQDRLDGIEHLVVPHGAVLTPAARDHLRDRNVRIRTATQNIVVAGGRKVRIAAAETRFDPNAIARTVAGHGIAVERVAQTGLVGVVDELCDGVAKGGDLAMLFTDLAAAAVCLANRHRGVRAVVATQQQRTAEWVASVGANFLIIEPAQRTTFGLNSIVREFVRGESRTCPPAWRERLG